MSLDLKYPGKGYVKALENIISKHGDIATLAMKVHDKEEFKLKTICHCDPWFNNVLFKDGAALYIDFQLSCYVSPALDINYLLASSSTGEVRREHLQDLLSLYHSVFSNTLDTIDITVDFTLEDLGSRLYKTMSDNFYFKLRTSRSQEFGVSTLH